MISKAAVIRQTILLSGAISVFPLVIYPSRFGFPPSSLSPAFAIAEWALYVLIFLAALPKLSWRRKLACGGLTVLYRLAVGAVLGALVTVMHGGSLPKMIWFCLWMYTPAVVLHVAFAPFVLRPVFGQVWRRGVRFAMNSGRDTAAARTPGFSFSTSSPAAPASRVRLELNEISFDAATSWVGEFSGVRMSLIVDEDGLVVSQWSRQTYSQDAEFWAAVTVETTRFHQRWPADPELVDLRRLEVETGAGRLVVRRAGAFWLAVLTEADAGELVSVRIAQAVEMIEKHYQDRYHTVRSTGLEVSHV